MPPAGTGSEAPTARRAPATVIVSQRVKSGRDDDYRRWQDDVKPTADHGEWTVLYRFDSKPNLEAWLASSDRDQLLDRGADLFDAPPSQRVLLGAADQDFVAVVVSHPVAPGREDEFLAWQKRLDEIERAFPGFGGSELFRPVPGVQEEWTSVFRFDTEEHLNNWLESPERKKLLDEGAEFQNFELHRIASPFGSWFSFGDAGAGAPPQWKTAFAVLVGLYPLVVVLTLIIAKIWPDGALWQTLLLGNALSVPILTWVVMPIVTRGLRFWLVPHPREAGPRLDAIGTAISVGVIVFPAIVFWLVTTQIWTLP